MAEDDDSNFRLTKATIGKKCDIQWAKSGEEIVVPFKEYGSEAGAIPMDIKMPVMNGLDVTRIIRGENKGIPIIMQIAYAFGSNRESMMNAGASKVLVKPIALSILRNTLTRYFPELI